MRKHWTLTIPNPIWFIWNIRSLYLRRQSDKRIARFKAALLADDLSVTMPTRYAVGPGRNPWSPKRELLDIEPERVVVRA